MLSHCVFHAPLNTAVCFLKNLLADFGRADATCNFRVHCVQKCAFKHAFLYTMALANRIAQ